MYNDKIMKNYSNENTKQCINAIYNILIVVVINTNKI